MDRIIQPYGSTAPGGVKGTSHAHQPPGIAFAHPAAHPPKAASDFVRALRRRVWLVLAVTLVVGLAGAALVLRQPAIYESVAEIQIVPPEFDPALTAIIGSAASISHENSEQYVLNRIAELQSKTLIERVLLELGPAAGEVTAGEVINGLTTRRVTGTPYFQVSLESRDQDRVARLLNALLKELNSSAKDENRKSIQNVNELASNSLSKLGGELKTLDETINRLIQGPARFSPDGRFVLEEEHQMLKSLLLQKKVRFDDLAHEQRMAAMWPNLHDETKPPSASTIKIGELLAQREQIDQKLASIQQSARGQTFKNDRYYQYFTRYREQIDAKIQRLQTQAQAPVQQQAPDLRAYRISQAAKEIRELENVVNQQSEQLQNAMPDYQRFLGLLKQREQLEAMIGSTQEQLSKFTLVSATQKDPVVFDSPTIPITPVRPNRPLGIALASIVGLILGIALVCLLESLDHSVKVPEQLTVGLTLPLFGVVPRMRRLARLDRGGHLWTPGVPDSLESDAFRNVRASLLGAERPEQPIVTLLVTSAKAGEGKSTTALNLAATCARAGERTILVDCDLRRPSLAEVFGADPNLGLADVLQGLMPWQRAVARTDIPNLSFLPAGDMTGVPIEVLGSLELRQLIAALAGHYHRVILDGPAVLGLADCRMLGQVVDATLLVVRSGAHELRPLRRAKEMLEQSRVKIAGVVFNGLSEDLENWSSDGLGASYAPGGGDGVSGRDPIRTRELDAPSAEPTVGSAGR